MKNLFFHYVSPEYSFAQCEGAGLSIRLGSRAWVFGHLGYREKNCPWPKWLRFRVVLHGPRNASMSDLPHYALYLFGRRVFDNLYWPRDKDPTP
jgi:hypothetical protein